MLPRLPLPAQTTDEKFLRQIFVRDQMAEWSRHPLIMERADGVFYWDVEGKRYYDAIAGIYTASVGHNNRRVIDAIKKQLDTLHFSPPMHSTNPVAVQLANLIADLAPPFSPVSNGTHRTDGTDNTEGSYPSNKSYESHRT